MTDAATTAATIWAEVQAGIPQPRPTDWPDIDAITAAGCGCQDWDCRKCRRRA